MPSFPSVDEQLSVLLRGSAQVETRDDLRKKLDESHKTGRPLRIKYGIDPTGFDVHLGHTVPLRKLRQFQEFGHTAVLIIGTATAEVGDPSGRAAERQGLDRDQIEKNAKTYLDQIAKVVDVSKAEVRPNGEWFHKFDFARMLRLLGSMTMQRMLERDDFSKRVASGTPIYLHECLYPLMQGHDSVEIRADLELGGTEQLFNLMVGRNLQRDAGQAPQVCLTMPILRGLDGVQKMGKSLGNFIGVAEPPREQFGKTMSIPDDLMREWFTLLTDRTEAEIHSLLAGHPMEAKKILASDVVAWFHGSDIAKSSRDDWDKQFSQKVDPADIPEKRVLGFELSDRKIGLASLLVLLELCGSKSEARNKIKEGAVTVGPDRLKITDIRADVEVSNGLVVRMGRKIARVKIEDPESDKGDPNHPYKGNVT